MQIGVNYASVSEKAHDFSGWSMSAQHINIRSNLINWNRRYKNGNF